MSPRLPFSLKSPISTRHSWHGMAFILEAMVLIAVIIASSVILMQLFSESKSYGERAHAISYAVILATNEAERFAADPYLPSTKHYELVDDALVPVQSPTQNGFTVVREIRREHMVGGVLFRAHITVEKEEKVLYILSLAHYVTAEEMPEE